MVVVCTPAIMADAKPTDYAALLEEIHGLELGILRDQLQAIRDMQEAGRPLETSAGIPIDPLAIVRAVEMALKRNSISAPLEDRSNKQQDMATLARKLDFKGISNKRKVIPFPPQQQEGA